jgi:hypothetical protein
MSKTLSGLDGWLYLLSEVQQHYAPISDNLNTSSYVENVLLYFHGLHSCTAAATATADNVYMFVVPDKSVVCKSHLIVPEIDECNHLLHPRRIIDDIHHPRIVDLMKHMPIDESHYYMTDSHINHAGSFLVFHAIVRYLFPEDSEMCMLHNYTSTLLPYRGDLTNKVNYGSDSCTLTEQTLRMYLSDDITSGVTEVSHELPVTIAFCFSRKSRHFRNTNWKLNKRICIFGDSTTDNKVLELFAATFKEVIFYWNHLRIVNEVVDYFQPDLLIDIRTERFLNIPPSFLLQMTLNPSNQPTNPFTEIQLEHRITHSQNILPFLLLLSSRKKFRENPIAVTNVLNAFPLIESPRKLPPTFNWIVFNQQHDDLRQYLFKELLKIASPPTDHFILDKQNKIIGATEDSFMYLWYIHRYFAFTVYVWRDP